MIRALRLGDEVASSQPGAGHVVGREAHIQRARPNRAGGAGDLSGRQFAEAPVRLALATLLQFMEGLTDRQAADAVRTRIDWKYLLCLGLTEVGFDHTVLSEFRTRLLAHGAEDRLFEAILELARGRGLLKGGGRQRSDSTHVLGAMRAMSRLEVVGETLRHALNVLATTAPDWLRAHTTPAWVGVPRSNPRNF